VCMVINPYSEGAAAVSTLGHADVLAWRDERQPAGVIKPGPNPYGPGGTQGTRLSAEEGAGPPNARTTAVCSRAQ